MLRLSGYRTKTLDVAVKMQNTVPSFCCVPNKFSDHDFYATNWDMKTNPCPNMKKIMSWQCVESTLPGGPTY